MGDDIQIVARFSIYMTLFTGLWSKSKHCVPTGRLRGGFEERFPLRFLFYYHRFYIFIPFRHKQRVVFSGKCNYGEDTIYKSLDLHFYFYFPPPPPPPPPSTIAQWYSFGLRVGWSGVRVLARAGNFSLHHRVQTDSGAHRASYPVGTRGSLPGGKLTGAWSWPLPPSVEVKECTELYLHSPNTSSWRMLS
jgi:hypothetical protein